MAKRILILHDLSVGSRRTNRDHVYSFAKYAKDNFYVFHGVNAPISNELKQFPFDGVILNYCFLGYRASNLYEEQRQRYSFLKNLQCKKVAICQDDYSNSADLDDWLMEIGVDVIYSPIQKNLEVIYPRNWNSGTEFRVGHTGYLDSQQVSEYSSYDLPFEERIIDVGTRVRMLPAYFGAYGQRKGHVVEKFAEAATKAGFVTDISTDSSKTLFGSDWLRFLGRCKFSVGSMGGAGINDPRGEIREKYSKFIQANPEASFESIEHACFPNQDGKHVFSAISPRLFEVSALGSCQILTEGDYVGGIQPYTDYIPLKDDFSNIDEVFSLMRDRELCEKMIESCKDKLIASGLFDYSVWVDEVLSLFPSSNQVTVRDAQKLGKHFGGMQEFVALRSNLGGTYEIALKRVLNTIYELSANDLYVLYEQVKRGREFCMSISRLCHDTPTKPFQFEAFGKMSFLARLADDANWKFVEQIIRKLLNGELAKVNLLTWDMCEVIYEESTDQKYLVSESDHEDLILNDVNEHSPVPRYADLDYIKCGLSNPEQLSSLAQEYSDRFGNGDLPLPYRIMNEKAVRRDTGLDAPIQELLKPSNPKARSVLFIHHAYYHFYYLAKALRDRGWHAVCVSMENPNSANQVYYHGHDFEFYSHDYEKYVAMQYEVFDAVKQHFKMLHFHADTTFSIFSENQFGNIERNGVPWDFLALKSEGVKIGHSISGCLTGQRKSIFNKVSGGACNKCVWQLDESVCSDAKNGFVGEKIKLLADLNALEIDWPGDSSRHAPNAVNEPLIYCLDEEIWKPNLKIPDRIERFERKSDEILVFHAVGNLDIRQSSERNIKGSGAVLDAIDRLQREGFAVRLVFKTGIKSVDMRYYQVQADIVVDQLNYGRYGATARETMMLGVPTICRLDREQPEGVNSSISLRECPLIDASEDTIYDVLKDLASNPDKLKVISKASREYALKWHSSSKCAERFERIYDRVMVDKYPLEHKDVYAGYE